MHSDQNIIERRVAGAILVPVLLLSAYLLSTRWPWPFESGVADWLALAVCSLAGAVFIALLPLRSISRIVLVLLYVPLCYAALISYCFVF